MKIQLAYDRPAKIRTDLVVIILDSQLKFHDLTGSPLDEMVRNIAHDFAEKRRKREYFASVNSDSVVQNVVIFSTTLSPNYNIWENLKTFVARPAHLAKARGLRSLCVLMNTALAAPFVGKAVEGAIIGGYTFDRYKTEKADLAKMQITLAALKSHDLQNRHYLERYTVVCNAVNEARDMINEPGSVATPEYLADAARKIAKDSDLDLKIWDENRLQKDGYNGLLQVGRGSSNPPRPTCSNPL